EAPAPLHMGSIELAAIAKQQQAWQQWNDDAAQWDQRNTHSCKPQQQPQQQQQQADPEEEGRQQHVEQAATAVADESRTQKIRAMRFSEGAWSM
ncbi:MAG: hypothetical protein Q9177_006898, partial [Variospora cf. flavescens]